MSNPILLDGEHVADETDGVIVFKPGTPIAIQVRASRSYVGHVDPVPDQPDRAVTE